MINLLRHSRALSYQDIFQRSESYAVFCCVQMRTRISTRKSSFALYIHSLLQLPGQSRETIKNVFQFNRST